MITATLQLRRSRFAHHLVQAVAAAMPAVLRHALSGQQQPLSAAEAASREAQEVRQLASSYARTDPGFASDLYAAAARHEGASGG